MQYPCQVLLQQIESLKVGMLAVHAQPRKASALFKDLTEYCMATDVGLGTTRQAKP